MTRDRAHDVAVNEATKNREAYIVYRLPAWPDGVYGVVPASRGLPPTAETLETVNAPSTGLLF